MWPESKLSHRPHIQPLCVESRHFLKAYCTIVLYRFSMGFSMTLSAKQQSPISHCQVNCLKAFGILLPQWCPVLQELIHLQPTRCHEPSHWGPLGIGPSCGFHSTPQNRRRQKGHGDVGTKPRGCPVQRGIEIVSIQPG